MRPNKTAFARALAHGYEWGFRAMAQAAWRHVNVMKNDLMIPPNLKVQAR